MVRLTAKATRSQLRYFGSQLRQSRQTKGLSIVVAARLAGIRPSEWERIEAGQLDPEATTADRIAEICDTTVENLARKNPERNHRG